MNQRILYYLAGNIESCGFGDFSFEAFFNLSCLGVSVGLCNLKKNEFSSSTKMLIYLAWTLERGFPKCYERFVNFDCDVLLLLLTLRIQTNRCVLTQLWAAFLQRGWHRFLRLTFSFFEVFSYFSMQDLQSLWLEILAASINRFIIIATSLEYWKGLSPQEVQQVPL